MNFLVWNKIGFLDKKYFVLVDGWGISVAIGALLGVLVSSKENIEINLDDWRVGLLIFV